MSRCRYEFASVEEFSVRCARDRWLQQTHRRTHLNPSAKLWHLVENIFKTEQKILYGQWGMGGKVRGMDLWTPRSEKEMKEEMEQTTLEHLIPFSPWEEYTRTNIHTTGHGGSHVGSSPYLSEGLPVWVTSLWSRERVWGERSSREELFWTDCDPLFPILLCFLRKG